MLGILLTVLKILLWIVLILLGIVLLIVLMVCLVPVRYGFEGSFYEKKCFSAKIRWIFISVTADNKYQDDLYYRVKVFGKALKTNDDRHPVKKTVKKSDKEVEKLVSDAEDDIETDIIHEETHEEKNEVTTAVYNTDTKKKGKNITENEKTKKTRKQKREKISVFDKIKATVNVVSTKMDHLRKFLDKPYTKHTIQLIKRAIKKIIRSVKPTKIKGEIVYGFNSPANTGKATGYFSLLMPLYYQKVSLVPDFHQKIFEGFIKIKGRIKIGSIIMAVLSVVLRKDFWRAKKLAEKI